MSARTGSRRDRLRALLADLKMPGALEAVDEVLATLDSGATTGGKAIERLLEAQVALRNSRRLETAMNASRLPDAKTLADFDFAFQPSLKREQIESLHELGFLARHENVVLLGPPGVGRTHLAISLAIAAAEAGHRVCHGTLAGLVESLEDARAAGQLARRLRLLTQSGAAGGRRDRLSAGQPRRSDAVLPTNQCAARAGLDRVDLEQGLRGVGRRAGRRRHGGGPAGAPAAPRPHRQHPGQQLPHARPPELWRSRPAPDGDGRPPDGSEA